MANFDVTFLQWNIDTFLGMRGGPVEFFGSHSLPGLVTLPTTTMDLLSIVATLETITITFNDTPTIIDVAILDRTRWIAYTGDQHIVINAVNVTGDAIVLSTTEMSHGSTYTLVMPNTTIANTEGVVYLGPFTENFTGFGVSPTILITQVIDARTIDVVFSEPVNKYDALNETNYSVNNGLTVVSVAQLSASIFRLTTSKQAVGTSYTVTASNIRDNQGNLT